jgi:hypothetical protein
VPRTQLLTICTLEAQCRTKCTTALQTSRAAKDSAMLSNCSSHCIVPRRPTTP